ncbi:hypothetical protein BJV82DRAFT_654046 [Fennellomyces sp. T-0311]|nr:hypothetical protein BJV82DRAFT_654046 [Fennellomyces sp. T-0311]
MYLSISLERRKFGESIGESNDASKFEQAAQDGLDANPHNTASQPDPYLTLGSALFLHGHLRKSAATYKIGANVVPKMHPQHGALVKKYQQAVAFIEKQNQLMAQLLPFQVISSILAKLSIKDRARRNGRTYGRLSTHLRTCLDTHGKVLGVFTRSVVTRSGAYAQFDDLEGFYYSLVGYNDEHDSDGDSVGPRSNSTFRHMPALSCL